MVAYHLPAPFEQVGTPALLEEVDEAVDGKLAGIEGVAGVQPPTELGSML